MTDNSDGESASVDEAYDGPLSSAEWVTEASAPPYCADASRLDERALRLSLGAVFPGRAALWYAHLWRQYQHAAGHDGAIRRGRLGPLVTLRVPLALRTQGSPRRPQPSLAKLVTNVLAFG